MTRVKRGNVARKRRNKVLKLAKGFRGSHSKLFRTANQQVMKALRNAYRDRRKKKRDFRSLCLLLSGLSLILGDLLLLNFCFILINFKVLHHFLSFNLSLC